MAIFLVGYMGSGKSTIGQKLSENLKYNFVDMDAYIATKEGMSIADLFRAKGEIYFRKTENHYLKEVIKMEEAVIALGGGTPCYGNNMQLIIGSKKSKSIYLKASIPNLVKRLKDEKENRPLISHLTTEEELTEFIGKHLFERSQFYTQCDITISVDNKPVNEIVEEVISKLF